MVTELAVFEDQISMSNEHVVDNDHFSGIMYGTYIGSNIMCKFDIILLPHFPEFENFQPHLVKNSHSQEN